MKSNKLLSLIVFFSFSVFISYAQDVVGTWKTIDEDTGVEKSIIKIYKEDGKLFGQVQQVLEKGKENKLCEKCKGDLKNKPVKGMTILKNLKDNDGTWEGGTILDPANGKEYKCYITLEEPNKLKVRGFIGFSLLGRTQYWERVN